MLYPGKEDISIIERTGLSIVLSMGSVLLIVLFIDEVLAFNTTPVNIVSAVLIFSLLALCVWKSGRILKEFTNRRDVMSHRLVVKDELNIQNFDSYEKKTNEEK